MLSTVRSPFTATGPLPTWGISIAQRGVDLYHVGIESGDLRIWKNAESATIKTGATEQPTIGIDDDGIIHVASNLYYYRSEDGNSIESWIQSTPPGLSISFFYYDITSLGLVCRTGAGFSILYNNLGEVGSLDHAGMQAISAKIHECPNGDLRGQFTWARLSNNTHISTENIVLIDRSLSIDSNIESSFVRSMVGCDNNDRPYTALLRNTGYLVESIPV